MITDDDKRWANKVAFVESERLDIMGTDYYGLEEHKIEVVDQFKVRDLLEKVFLLGVAHARKPHVVADGDLPEECQKVVAITHCDNHYVLWWESLGNDKYWYGEICRAYKWRIDQIKYWWPLPEVEVEK